MGLWLSAERGGERATRAGLLAREGKGRSGKRAGASVGRAGREGEEEGLGRHGGKRAGMWAMGKRKGGPAVWAANWVWAGFSFLFLGFPFLSYLKTTHSI